MNKSEFLENLREGLQGVAPEERVAALQYYTEYLDDAGIAAMASASRRFRTSWANRCAMSVT